VAALREEFAAQDAEAEASITARSSEREKTAGDRKAMGRLRQAFASDRHGQKNLVWRLPWPARTARNASKKGRRGAGEAWALRLYIAGRTARAMAAFANLERICKERLEGEYSIEVIDLLKNPQLAKGDQILAVPTLVRRLPHASEEESSETWRTRSECWSASTSGPSRRGERDECQEARGQERRACASRPGATRGDEAQAIRRGIERQRKKGESERYVLRLYVTGATPASTMAIERVKECANGVFMGATSSTS